MRYKYRNFPFYTLLIILADICVFLNFSIRRRSERFANFKNLRILKVEFESDLMGDR